MGRTFNTGISKRIEKKVKTVETPLRKHKRNQFMQTWLFGKENNISRNFNESHEIPDKAVAIPLCDRRKGG